MLYLLLCIISSSLLMVIFKIAGRRNLDNYRVIVINYIVASIFGFLIGGFPGKLLLSEPWLPLSLLIGVLFILIFLVMAKSTQISGISSTTVASKMSVVIPILFSIVYFNETTGLIKVLGIALALTAVFLAIYRKSDAQKKLSTVASLPLILFLGTGIIDSLIKYTQEVYLSKDLSIVFTSTLFMVAALCGILFAPFRKKNTGNWFHKETILTGLVLGLINFGSLYGIVNALESKVFDSSIVFGINNIGIVLLSVVLALIVFDEKLSSINKIGIGLSIVSIIILSLV